jgi:2-methylisocitrate lyase-like PEP mutase family enzyme
MTSQRETAAHFLSLHHGPTALLMPNPWDVGSARILESLGFGALATTSSGHAGTLGRLDGGVTVDEAIEHATAVAGAVEVPVSADLENGFADDPEAVAATIRRALTAGLAGCSVEDYSRETGIYAREVAAERVRAAAETAHAGDVHLVLTARAENLIRGNPDLADTIARLQSFQDAGADVLFAAGLSKLEDIRQVVASVDLPLSVLALPNAPTVAELSDAGVKRISVGGTFFYAGVGAVAEAARELLEQGTYGFWSLAGPGSGVARAAFTS